MKWRKGWRIFSWSWCEHPEKLHELHDDLTFLPKRLKLEKVGKLVTNLHGKTEYVIHIQNLIQGLNYRLILKIDHWVIKLNEHVWLKPYMDMNTKLRKKEKNILKKTFSSWCKMQFLEKLWKMWGNIEILNL